MTLPKAIICDLDGTLSNHRHRLHFVDPKYLGKDWSCRSVPSERQPVLDFASHPLTKHEWYNHQGIVWKPDREAFYAAMDKDAVNEAVSEIIYSWYLYEADSNILIVTGIPWKHQHSAEIIIEKALPEIERTEYIKLFMRPDFLPLKPFPKTYTDPQNGKTYRCEYSHTPEQIVAAQYDHRPSHVVKKEIFEREIAGKYDILFVLEDDDRCVEMYRGLGLTCLKVCLP